MAMQPGKLIIVHCSAVEQPLRRLVYEDTHWHNGRLSLAEGLEGFH